ncbi:hypothetical protein WN943_015154 [Citrus x changshan-huyou]
METTSSSSSTSSPSAAELISKSKRKEALGWMEWLRGWLYVIYEMLFQRILASHLQNPLPLPPVNDLTCIVTGSTSGIGREIARQLAESGAHVVMAVRNLKAANELIQKWQEEWSGKGLPLNIEAMELDLLSLDSVVRFAEAWNARLGPLHVLINNAGIFSIGEPQKFSKDGYEEHMQVNHLAPALLSILLFPSLIRGSPSRIINVNSVMHYVGFVDTEDMNVVSGRRKYTSLMGYSGSKLAQIKFSSILQKRLPAESGINVVCVSPGIVSTNVVSFFVHLGFFYLVGKGYRHCKSDSSCNIVELSPQYLCRGSQWCQDVWMVSVSPNPLDGLCMRLARDLPKIVQAAYHLIPYFIFNPQEGVSLQILAYLLCIVYCMSNGNNS